MNSLIAALFVSQLGAAPMAAAPSLEVQQEKLDNGLTLLLSRDTRLPVVAVEIRYFVGSAHERAGRTGFAHLFEHLMFQGSKNFNDEYFKPFEPIGGAVNGTTNVDRTNYYERVPSNYLERVLWMESDRMANLLPALTQKKLDNQRDVVKNERRQSYEDRPYGMAWKHLAESLYPTGHPYHHLTIGSHEDLTAASLDDVKAFFRKYYVPANASLTIVGDFDPAQAKELAIKYFGGMEAGERAPRPKGDMPKLTSVQHIVSQDEVKLPRVYLAWHTPALYEAGDSEMDVVASVLTQGKTSRLYKPLVYDQKVAKDVVAFQASQLLSSFFVVYATAAPGKTADELAKALMDALTQALATPPTADELARAVNAWRKSFYGRVESVLQRAQLISSYYHHVGKPSWLAKDLARYTELTPQRVDEAAKKWLDLNAHVRIDILPKAAPGGAK